MFKIGERVRYLDDVGEATIVSFIDDRNVMVEDEWGLKHSHPVNKLVPADRDHIPEPTRSQPVPIPQPIAKSKPIESKRKSAALPDLALAFISTSSTKPETGDLDLIFSNSTNYHVLVNIAAKEGEEWYSIYHGEVLPKADGEIQSLRRQDIGTVSNLQVDVIFFGTAGYELKSPVNTRVKIKATRFVKPGNYQLYDGIENPAIVIPIQNEPIAKVHLPTPVKRQVSSNKTKPSLPVFEEEVDLHLEAILGEDPIGMPDHEKYLTQIRHFERRLNHALTHRYVQITFIHGVGSGKLKEAIRRELKEYDLPYEDGAFHKYGVGATVVQLH